MNDFPSDVDDILSLLGEIDIIKSAINSFDKSINIALATDKVSDLIGPEGHFYILKKMEMVHASTVELNIELLNIAEKLASTTNPAPIDKGNDNRGEENISPAQPKKNVPNLQNPLVNNVLEYLNERLMKEDDDE